MFVELLILGAGWTSSFLIPLLEQEQKSFLATSRSGRAGTIPFEFDPQSDDLAPFESLPDAQTILITFPLTEGAEKLVNQYQKSRKRDIETETHWIQLGTTGMWKQVRLKIYFFGQCLN